MQNIKMKLKDDFYRNDYKAFLGLLNTYLNKGYGVDFDIIKYYLLVLIKLRKYDDVYKLTKKLEEDNKYLGTYDSLFFFYLYSFHPQDAERIYLTKPINIPKKSQIVKMYLLMGNIKEAKEKLNQYLHDKNDSELLEQKRLIDNYYRYNAFIEMEYSCFIQNGNKLEPGHIVYLKNNPKSNIDIHLDDKRSSRPYMIWKIDDNKVYFFPVTTSLNERRFKLYSQKYPNSIGDRVIKDNLCFTTLDNILSVSDKVLDDDLSFIFKDLYYSSYFGHNKDEKKANGEFMQSYHHNIQKHDVIEEINPITKIRKYYFILHVNTDNYDVIEIDLNELKVIGKEMETYKKGRLIYKVIKLTNSDVDTLIKQIPTKFILPSLTGTKIEADNYRYIVIYDNKNYSICIGELYSPSYINLTAIKKSDINEVFDKVSQKELDFITQIIIKNNPQNLSKMIKKYK